VRSILGWARANITEVLAQERAQYQVKDAAGENARSIIEMLRRQSEAYSARAETVARSAIQREAGVHTRKWVASVQSGAQIDVSRLLADDDLINVISVRSEYFTSLIRNLSGDMVSRIEREVLGSVFEGRGNADVAKALQQIEGIGRNRARLIARDQATKLNSAMNQYRQEQAGVTHYKWKTVLDGRERKSHHDRNNRIFPWNKPPSDGHPGHAINCRCRALPVLVETPEDAAQIAPPAPDVGDVASQMDLISRAGGTLSEDVLSWPRDRVLTRAAETNQAIEALSALRTMPEVDDVAATKLFTRVYGFEPKGGELAKLAGTRTVSAYLTQRRTLVLQAVKSRLETVQELLEHAAMTAAVQELD